MTKKYEKQCWSCSSKDVENKGSYVKCRHCGATYSPINKPSGDLITMVRDYSGRITDDRKRKSPSPSAILQRQAAKARESAVWTT